MNIENGQIATQKCALKAAKSGSAAYILSKVNPLFFIDFKTCESDKYAKNFLSTSQSYHNIGAVFSSENDSYKSKILDAEYYGLIFRYYK